MLQEGYLGGDLQGQGAGQQFSAQAGHRASGIPHCSHERCKVCVGGQARAGWAALPASAAVQLPSSGAHLAQVGLGEVQSAGNQRHKVGQASCVSTQEACMGVPTMMHKPTVSSITSEVKRSLFVRRFT